MAENSVVRAPYNFVPFSNRVLPYQGEVPAHDSTDPALKTGEIHVTLEAVTPVFVSDGNKNDPHFIKGPNGRFMLPGSTIRGMVRQNMQILGFGLVRPGEDVEDKRFFYRRLADRTDSVYGELRNHYRKILNVKTEYQNNRPYAVPRNIQAGYLRKVGKNYQIQPVKGTFLRVSRKHPDVAEFGNEPSRAFEVSYTVSGTKVGKICRGRVPGMYCGVLLYTGRPIGRKQNPLYLFPEADESAQPVVLEQDALINATDSELLENFRRGGGHNENFWKLPKDGEEKPVFYVRYQGHTFFGMSLFLRLRYLQSTADGIPSEHREKDEDFLDYLRAILGYTDRPGRDGKPGSLRSRVSFGNFTVLGEPKELPVVRTILGEPKASYFPGYIEDGKHYDDKGFRLRGYKHYWLKEAGAVKSENVKTSSTLRPLSSGTKFSGVIRYKNLRPEELGLLLWALRLEDGCYQTVGMGKPYGYGRMKLTIDELREYDLSDLYTPGGLCSGGVVSSEGKIQAYIDCYDALVAEAICPGQTRRPFIACREEIKDFFCLHGMPPKTVNTSYMPLANHSKMQFPLPSVKEIREEAEKAGYNWKKEVQYVEKDHPVPER